MKFAELARCSCLRTAFSSVSSAARHRAKIPARMKAAFFVFCLALLTGCSSGGTIDRLEVSFQPQPLQPSTVPRSGVVFLGDSIFGGWDLNAEFHGQGYINGGMFGYRTDQLLALLPDVLSGQKVCHGLQGDPNFPLTCVQLSQPPAKIVLFAGWNDMIQSIREDMIVLNLRTIVDQAHAQGVEVVLCVPYRWDSAHLVSWMQPFTPTSAVFPYSATELPLDSDLRATQSTPLADFDSALFGQSAYTVDGLHPDSAGHAAMHNALVGLLQ
jgi:lysophospholipase L1-like esterase